MRGHAVGTVARGPACGGSPGHAPGPGLLPCSPLLSSGPPLATALLKPLLLARRPKPPGGLLQPLAHWRLMSLSPLVPPLSILFPTSLRSAWTSTGPALTIGPDWPWLVEWESGFL